MPEIKIDLYKDYPQVKVFVGGCIERGDGSSFRAMAHSHVTGDFKGWVCVRSHKRLVQKRIMYHELAHILTGEGHTDRWRAKVRELGGTIEYWETKEYFQLKRKGIYVRGRISKTEAKKLLARYSK